MANDKAEYCDEDAESGRLILPSPTVKLPDRECALASLDPVTADMFKGCICGLRLGLSDAPWPPMVARESLGAEGREEGRGSMGTPWLPIGVARESVGAAGRDEGLNC